MATIAFQEGIPENVLHQEPEARNTFENLSFSQTMMTTRGWRTATVISDDWHLPRARFCARKLGLEARFQAVIQSLLPSPPLIRLAARLREVAARAKYRALYR